MEEYTEKQRMEGYIDFSVERKWKSVQMNEGYIDFSERKWKRIQRSKEWKGI